MGTRITLRAVGWNHERCMRPMRAAAAAWAELHPEVEVEWLPRSGLSFAEQPLEELVESYDLLVIDHPFVGQASRSGCLAPLDDLLDADELAALANDAIGPSHRSYEYDGRQWGLATDAACQVSAVRDDLLGARSLPATWDDVLELARETGGRVAAPLSHHGAICSLLTLCANAGAPPEGGGERLVDPATGERALAWMLEFVRLAHPRSLHLDPPSMLDWMTESREILYAPLTFGYTNYSRPDSGRPHRVRFVDIPSTGLGPVGSILGGAGLSVSAKSAHPVEAAAFAAWATGAEAQVAVVFPNGGQPGSRTAWLDPEVDAASGGFMSGTRRTIEASYVRPCDPWWPSVQRDGDAVLRRFLEQGGDPARALDDLEEVYQREYERTRTR